VVVSIASAICRDRLRARHTLPSAVLLAAAVLPGPSADVSPLSLQLRAIAGSPQGLSLPANELGYGTALPAAQLPPTAGLSLSLPSPFGWALNPIAGITTQVDEAAAAADASLVAATTIAAPRPREATPGSIHIDCAWMALTLQSGGDNWNTLPYDAMPTSLAPPVRLGASPANPVQGPSGNRSNLPRPGPAGAWCRPPPVPIAQTSPLSNQSFWIPVLLATFGVGVFWLSRGLEMPP
jgi:hypothetical protein